MDSPSVAAYAMMTRGSSPPRRSGHEPSPQLTERLEACERETAITVQHLKAFAVEVIEERRQVANSLEELKEEHDALRQEHVALQSRHETEVSALHDRITTLEAWLLESFAAQQAQQQARQEQEPEPEPRADDEHADPQRTLREQAEAEAIAARQLQVQQRIEAEAAAVAEQQQAQRRFAQAEAQATSAVHAHAHAHAMLVAATSGDGWENAEGTADAMIEAALESPQAAGALGLVPPAIAEAFARFDVNGDGVLDYSELRRALREYGLDIDLQMAAQVS